MIDRHGGNGSLRRRAGHPERDETILLDMHVHSTCSRDSLIQVNDILKIWETLGILSVICDHNTTHGSELLSREIRMRGCDIPGIIAEEILTSQGEIIGLFLSEEIPPHLSAAETLDRIHDQGGLSLVPHPFCTYRSTSLGRAGLDRLNGRIDLVEGYNSRVLRDHENLLARSYAIEKGKLITAGSDAHTSGELGRTFLAVPAFESPREFLRSLPEARVYFRPAGPEIHSLTNPVRPARGTGRK